MGISLRQLEEAQVVPAMNVDESVRIICHAREALKHYCESAKATQGYAYDHQIPGWYNITGAIASLNAVIGQMVTV